MDRRLESNKHVGVLLDRFRVDFGYDKPKGIVAGFVSVSEFSESCEIIANLAYLLASRSATVCAVDFKVFYPNLVDWFGGISADSKGEGLIRLLNSEKTDVRHVARKTDDKNVFLVSPSPNDDIEDYLSFSIDDVSRIISVLKGVFDVVLIDIPNNPALEFCLGAMMQCHKGFFIASERIDAPRNIQKLLEFAMKITNNAESFQNIILSHQQSLVYDERALTEPIKRTGKNSLGLRIAARIPFIKNAVQCALDGKVFIRDGSYINKRVMKEGIHFTDEMTSIADIIWGGPGIADA